MIQVNVSDKVVFPVGDGMVFEAISRTTPLLKHFVVVTKDKGIICSCQGFQSGKHCWHIDAVPLCLQVHPDMCQGQLCNYGKGHLGGHSWENASNK